MKQVRTIAVREIIQTYRQTLGMEVTQYFRDHSVVEVLRCLDTGYTFYYPFDIFADAQFYEQLSKNSWYYQQNSWEHSVACTRIEAGARVLEVGAGDGAFLEQVSALGAVGVGLELNPSAVAAAQGYRRQVIRETLQRHIARVCTPYDVVCLFQVLEHLSDPVSVLRQAISVLKPGGLLIIAVPNNDQNKRSLFVRRDDALNLPPHHAALWDLPTLCHLTTVLPLTLESISTEPAKTISQQNTYRGELKIRLAARYGIAGRALYYAARPLLKTVVAGLSEFLPAHSVLATYSLHESPIRQPIR